MDTHDELFARASFLLRVQRWTLWFLLLCPALLIWVPWNQVLSGWCVGVSFSLLIYLWRDSILHKLEHDDTYHDE